MTGGKKVFRQNICSYFRGVKSHWLKVEFHAISENGLRNFVSVLFECSEIIFERSKVLVWTNLGSFRF